jgi:hypothetical protein
LRSNWAWINKRETVSHKGHCQTSLAMRPRFTGAAGVRRQRLDDRDDALLLIAPHW